MKAGYHVRWRELIDDIGDLYMQRVVTLYKQYGVETDGVRWGILFALRHEDGRSQKNLAQQMGVKPPSVTMALRKLEADGYIRKEQDPHDQRITRIYLQESGRSQALRGEEAIYQAGRELFAGITGEERRMMKQILDKMKQNLENRSGMEERKKCYAETD